MLGLWCRPAAAPPIRPLAWEPPYAVDAALKKKKDDKKKKRKKMTKRKEKRKQVLKECDMNHLFLKGQRKRPC